MSGLLRFYKTLNLLSLDVVAGAVISAIFFSKILGVVVMLPEMLCLSLTVWIIYTADHLYDVWKLKNEASTDRHQFHQRHFKLLTTLMCAATVLDLGCLFYLKSVVLVSGVLLFLVVALYFVFQSRLKFLKEFVGAILYSAGVLLPTLPIAQKPFPDFTPLLIFQFALTALLNLILFSWFDIQRDIKDGRASIVTFIGAKAARVVLALLFIIQAIISIFLLTKNVSLFPVFTFLVMNLVLGSIMIYARYFAVSDRFRYAGDAIFFLPVFYLLFLHV